MLINVSKDYATKRFSFSAERQKTIQSFVKEKVAEWKPDSQVVLILDKMPPGFTGGYNHWSTRYLRYITNRTDIIGLIGQNSWLKYNPIIKNTTTNKLITSDFFILLLLIFYLFS